MSMPRKEKAACPKCGADCDFTLWQSINTEVDFAIPQIISGELFKVKCKSCGLETYVDYPILFNDMIHDVMIQYVHQEEVPEAREALNHLGDLNCRGRIVTDQLSLREKTAIFNLGLDDRVIEVMKLVIIAQLADSLNGKEVEDIIFVEIEGKWYFELLVDGQSGHAGEIDKGLYTAIEKSLGDVLAADKEYVIDSHWARQAIAGNAAL